MLKIRLTRTGKNGQPSFRVVLAEQARAVKGKYIELLGNYLPALQPKKVELKKDRIEYWIAKGAQPTDTVAALLKRNGFSGMEKFMEPRDKKHKSKNEAAAPAAAPAAAAEQKAQAAPEKEEAPAAA